MTSSSHLLRYLYYNSCSYSFVVIWIDWCIITDTLSTSDHIREVIKSCAQTQYALRVLCAHGLTDSGLHTFFRSVVVAKIMYASSACSGFVNKQDLQRIDAFLRPSKKCGFCPTDLPSLQELRDAADELLFDKIQQKPPSLLPTTATFGCITDLQSPKKTA